MMRVFEHHDAVGRGTDSRRHEGNSVPRDGRKLWSARSCRCKGSRARTACLVPHRGSALPQTVRDIPPRLGKARLRDRRPRPTSRPAGSRSVRPAPCHQGSGRSRNGSRPVSTNGRTTPGKNSASMPSLPRDPVCRVLTSSSSVRSRASSSQVLFVRTLAGSSATTSEPGRAWSSLALTRIQRRAPVLVRPKRPVSFLPWSTNERWSGSSRRTSSSPSSQMITAPLPRPWPSWTPSNSPAASEWSATGTARRRTVGSSEGPLGTAHERSTSPI